MTKPTKTVSFEVFKELVPKSYKKLITEDFVDEVNKISADIDYGREFAEDMLTHVNILSENANWSLDKYLEAIKFYSLTAQQWTHTDAYCAVFPHRLQARIDRGEDKSHIGGEASRFNSNALVNRIRTQALVPFYLVNQGSRQEALNIAVSIARNSRSDMARVNAINAILGNTAAPETSKIEVDINLDTKDSISDLRKATEALAIQQGKSMEAGMSVKAIAESIIVEAEIEYE